MKAPLPPDESQRLATLRDYHILDTGPEAVFDDLTILAAQICQTPIAIISLVDEHRQWFKSSIGLAGTETPRDLAFCAHTILNKDEVLEVNDARADPRFADLTPVTSEPHIRFYAGAPLVAPAGHVLGALCVIDRLPRQLTAEQRAALRALSRHTVTQLELRRRARDLGHEVAERRRSEEALTESKQFLQSTLDALSAEIAILDESGVIVAVNAARNRFARENVEVTGGEGTGANYLEICDRSQGECAADAAAVARGIRAVMAGETAEFHREYPCHSATAKRWYIVHVTRFGEAGARRIVVAHVDITQRKRVEQRLRVSDTAIKAVSQGVLIAGPDRLILSANKAFTVITGYSEAEIVGQNCKFLQGPLTDPATVAAIRQALQNATDFAGEILNYRKDGTAFWNELTVSPVRDEQGRLIHFIGVTRDITARKEAEGQLEDLHRQLLATSRQAGMAEVATSVLHNVGNVLNSVNVSATLMGDQLRKSKLTSVGKVAALFREQAADLPGFFATDARAGQLPGYLDQLAQHLTAERAALLGEVEHLRKNIDHIKDIVAMQQSYAKVSGVTEVVHPVDLIDDALNMNAGSLDRHAIEVIREIGAVPPIEMDKHKVLQILINFVRNAKYACDDSGRTDKRIILRVQRSEDRVIFSVIDNGVGIHPENLGRIFNHGFTTKKDGHGFGLHSGANAAREMGGRVSVHSDGPGCGATFTLELPIAGSRSREAEKAAVPTPLPLASAA
ncbi:MAG: PAS domain S-box protein [Opitutaceae bacterium]